MSSTYSLRRSYLPPRILEGIFTFAALKDRRVACRLVLVCRASREWIEPIIYSVIKLTRQLALRKFLNTVVTSRRPQSFYEENVRSLVITQHTHIPSLVQVLLACSRISHLTYWSLPDQLPSPTLPGAVPPSTPFFISGATEFTSGERLHHEFPDDCFETVRPSRLAVSLRAWSGLIPLNPDFSRGFYSRVTHLSVLNAFDEWSQWSNWHALPALTHLALDVNVARVQSPSNRVLPDPLQRLGSIARCLRFILKKCRRLEVLVVLMLLGDDPNVFVAQVVAAMNQIGEEESRVFPFHNPVDKSDQRLVFMKKVNAFGTRQAHEEAEAMIWILAGQEVRRQARPSARHSLPRVVTLNL
ncbi:hypothetical protein BKA70DRAFT_1512670 [Coprinopsis sp. MPI-PUGE-AT-0042]|nr:hypothetical protein BKA70DRAFT_1512670 [Coprinopsis sp. MPI-PUGE-AT-0042]